MKSPWTMKAAQCSCLTLLASALVPAQALGQTQPDAVSLGKTQTVCELMGLGAIGTVPHNFPGADAQTTTRYRASLNPGIVELELPAGANAAAPAILGGDLGAPFLHGDGKLYFTFGDSWFESPARSIDCSTSDPSCVPAVGNDDILATAAVNRWQMEAGCLELDVIRVAGTRDIQPLTWNGPANMGGQPMAAIVPGPGFSTGRFMFMLAPGEIVMCGGTDAECAVASGVETDVCSVDPTGVHRCFFGECANDPQSPCGLRFNASRLLVRSEGTDFTEPIDGVHVASSHVFESYRGHFSVLTFYSDVDLSTGSGSLWVIGRDSFWGAPGLTLNPYLMVHPVENGRLEEPMFFAGFARGAPIFSPNAADARSLYEERVLLPQHTSLVFEPDVDGGTWLMMYGGHAQPVLRNNIAQFVRPVVDDLFYSRDSGVVVRTAKNPWGPWSEPTLVFSPFHAGQGGYCEHMYFEDPAGDTEFDCPGETASRNSALNRVPGLGSAGEYGVAIVPGAAEVSEQGVRLRWLMSTWNPYRVLLQESELGLHSARVDPSSDAGQGAEHWEDGG